jgi:hypothetical protein
MRNMLLFAFLALLVAYVFSSAQNCDNTQSLGSTATVLAYTNGRHDQTDDDCSNDSERKSSRRDHFHKNYQGFRSHPPSYHKEGFSFTIPPEINLATNELVTSSPQDDQNFYNAVYRHKGDKVSIIENSSDKSQISKKELDMVVSRSDANLIAKPTNQPQKVTECEDIGTKGTCCFDCEQPSYLQDPNNSSSPLVRFCSCNANDHNFRFNMPIELSGFTAGDAPCYPVKTIPTNIQGPIHNYIKQMLNFCIIKKKCTCKNPFVTNERFAIKEINLYSTNLPPVGPITTPAIQEQIAMGLLDIQSGYVGKIGTTPFLLASYSYLLHFYSMGDTLTMDQLSTNVIEINTLLDYIKNEWIDARSSKSISISDPYYSVAVSELYRVKTFYTSQYYEILEQQVEAKDGKDQKEKEVQYYDTHFNDKFKDLFVRFKTEKEKQDFLNRYTPVVAIGLTYNEAVHMNSAGLLASKMTPNKIFRALVSGALTGPSIARSARNKLRTRRLLEIGSLKFIKWSAFGKAKQIVKRQIKKAIIIQRKVIRLQRKIAKSAIKSIKHAISAPKRKAKKSYGTRQKYYSPKYRNKITSRRTSKKLRPMYKSRLSRPIEHGYYAPRFVVRGTIHRPVRRAPVHRTPQRRPVYRAPARSVYDRPIPVYRAPTRPVYHRPISIYRAPARPIYRAQPRSHTHGRI